MSAPQVSGDLIKRVTIVDAGGNSVSPSTTTKTGTLTASNTTANIILFRITGAVRIDALYGVVTTALSSNVTATHWRLNDQTAQVDISLASGSTISSYSAGSVISRASVAGTALQIKSAAAGGVLDPIAATAPGSFMPFIAVQKTGGVQTDIEFRYTTTNTPATGAIQFFCRWTPVSADGNLVAV
jgi:hypothetical protein